MWYDPGYYVVFFDRRSSNRVKVRAETAHAVMLKYGITNLDHFSKAMIEEAQAIDAKECRSAKNPH